MSVFSCGSIYYGLNILHSLVPKSQVTTQVAKLENGDFVGFGGLEIRKQKQNNLTQREGNSRKAKGWGSGLWNVPKMIHTSLQLVPLDSKAFVMLPPEDIID